MSILQGGFGLPIFSPSLYQYLVNEDISCITVNDNDIPDPGLKELVRLVSCTTACFLE